MALDFGKLNFSTSFNPTSAFPIDARTYFESLEAAQAAAATAEAAGSSNTTYYIGQIFTVYEEGEVSAYQVTAAKALQKLASTTASGDLASDVAALQSQVGALQTAMNTAESDIAGIKDGTITVGKATADADGNNIAATYETKANVTALAGRVTTAEGEIDTLQATVGEHTTDITALEANVGILQTTVGNAGSGLVKDVNDLKTQIGGVTGALHFKGVVEELPVDLSTYNEGDVILVGNKEYVCNDEDGTKSWIELGDEGSYALKTTTINGKPLSANVTLNASDVEADPAGTAAAAIAALDVAAVAVNANETVASVSETDGKIAVTKQAINITQAQVEGLTEALANVASSEALDNAVANITILQGNVVDIEGNVTTLQSDVATKVNASQVTEAIANATIEASKINGAVANAQYATQAGALVNSITINVNGTETSFNGGETATINITAQGLGALTEIPQATNEAFGGIKTGFAESGTNYAVKVDSNGAGYVTVPVPEVAQYFGTNSVNITANGSNYDVAVAEGGILTAMIAANAVTSDKIASVSTDAFIQGTTELVLNGGTSAD